MSKTIAVIASGAMGSAVGARLSARGARVVTSLAGRSAASAERARAAGMQAVSDGELAAADVFLSIVPPDQAAAVARRFATAAAQTRRRPVYIDLNAISPHTTEDIAAIVTPSGAAYIDGGIIGGPPKDGYAPTFYLSGATGGVPELLGGYGLSVKVVDGGIGAASALKMAYAGMTTGFLALGCTMLLAADRAGIAGALRAELGNSQPEFLARLSRTIPDMLPKAYRWVPEMDQIRQFVGPERPESVIFKGASDLYGQIADDFEDGSEIVPALMRFFSSAA